MEGIDIYSLFFVNLEGDEGENACISLAMVSHLFHLLFCLKNEGEMVNVFSPNFNSDEARWSTK